MDICVVLGGVHIVPTGQGICRGHLYFKEGMIHHIEVLEEEEPLGLSSRKFLQFLEAGEVLMVCKNLYREGES